MRDGAVNHLYQGLATLMRRRAELSAEVHPGLSLTAYTVLTQIQAAPGTRACDLADLFGLDKSTISRQLNELQAAGLIGREGERPGRRGYTLVLTAQGQRQLEQEALTQLGLAGQKPVQHFFVTDQDETHAGMTLDNPLQGRDHDAGPGVAAHCVYRDDQFARHANPF